MLTPSEQNYAKIEKGLLSVLLAIEHFHQYTYGRDVIVENNHKPLEIIDRKATAKAPGNLLRILLQRWTVHVTERNLLLVDTPSRAYVKDKQLEEPVFDAVNSVIITEPGKHGRFPTAINTDVGLRPTSSDPLVKPVSSFKVAVVRIGHFSTNNQF